MMITQGIKAGVPFAWFTADETYRQAEWLEDQDMSVRIATMAIR